VFRGRVRTARGHHVVTLKTIKALVDETGEGAVGVGIPGTKQRTNGDRPPFRQMNSTDA